MTDLRQAAQQALDALEWHYRQGNSNTLGGWRLKIDEKALRDLRAALAEPVQETEAFGFVTVRRLSQRFENHHDQYQFYPAGQIPYLDNVDECHTVYTTPPQRKPLTDEEIGKAWSAADGEHNASAAVKRRITRAIEAAHGIKEGT